MTTITLVLVSIAFGGPVVLGLLILLLRFLGRDDSRLALTADLDELRQLTDSRLLQLRATLNHAARRRRLPPELVTRRHDAIETVLLERGTPETWRALGVAIRSEQPPGGPTPPGLAPRYPKHPLPPPP